MFPWLKSIVGNPNQRKIKRFAPIVDQINDLEPDFLALSDEALQAKTQQFKAELANRERSDNPTKDAQLEQDVLALLLPEAFATVREASRRVLGMRHFDVQLIGGMVLHDGGIAEMRTGEGKTLVATLPAYLNALTGKGVHVITVNDYLAKRDAEWMGQVHQFLGLTVGTVLSGNTFFGGFEAKKAAYACDITYGTNNEFGFDYLRDNMAKSKAQLCQRPFYHAIIDEVDSILIDEARTPLIISGRLEQSEDTYRAMALIAPQLDKETHYTVDEKGRNVVLTEEGIDHAQALLGVDDLFAIETNFAHHLLQALKAKEIFRKDIEYVVKGDEVVIVDEFTGRLMDGRRWSDGQHQAVEAKEGVSIQDETQTLASITFQNLFRLYPKLSGMTGTAMTEEAEFGKIYSLEVTTIPTNRSDSRTNLPDMIYKNERIKYIKAVEEVIEQHQKGRPVLVGTVSIEKSEFLSHLLSDPTLLLEHLQEKADRLLSQLNDSTKSEADKALLALLQPMLGNPHTVASQGFLDVATALSNPKVAGPLYDGLEKRLDLVEPLKSLAITLNVVEAVKAGLPHKVLNAKHHEQEAMIVSQAGRLGAITIATNMAGRGTDILLGGNAESLAKQQFIEEGLDWRQVSPEAFDVVLKQKQGITDSEKQQVVELGGLHIIGTERHESRRIDNQLRGRAARQGDPGSTRFYLSLEDSLMRLFGGQKIAGLMDMMNVDETMPITAPLVNKAIEGAQRKVEAYHFDMRKNVLQYDDVLTEQRKLIYEQRLQVLNGYNLKASISSMIDNEMERAVANHLPQELTKGGGGRSASTLEDWDPEAVTMMLAVVHNQIPQLSSITTEQLQGKTALQVVQLLQDEAQQAYGTLAETLYEAAKQVEADHGVVVDGPEAGQTKAEHAALSDEARHPIRRIERELLLSVIDAKWIDYLHNLDSLREGIGLRAYGQKDPLIEYKREAFELFQGLTYEIENETVGMLFRSRIQIEIEEAPEAIPATENAMMLSNGMMAGTVTYTQPNVAIEGDEFAQLAQQLNPEQLAQLEQWAQLIDSDPALAEALANGDLQFKWGEAPASFNNDDNDQLTIPSSTTSDEILTQRLVDDRLLPFNQTEHVDQHLNKFI
jgi:preprotein translocase subunit SecA